VNDQIQTNLISVSEEDWKTHCSQLYFNPDIQEEEDEEMAETIDYREDIIMEELDLVLRKASYRNNPDIDNLSVEILKNGRALQKKKILLFNYILHDLQISKSLETETVININKKGTNSNRNNYKVMTAVDCIQATRNYIKSKLPDTVNLC
jgi:hypothetical protein